MKSAIRIEQSRVANRIDTTIQNALRSTGIALLPPLDVQQTLTLMDALSYHFDTTMLDPWYNKGVGGHRDDYRDVFLRVIQVAGTLSDHVYFWGFPEIVAPFVERIPEPLKLTCWLTWYYKNNPSVIRGWRSSQNACLHLSREEAVLYPQRFLNDKQLALQARGKLRYMPGPTSVVDAPFDSDLDAPMDVIENPLLVGFVGRKEQTGHPSQKPFKVYEQLLKMTMSDGGLLLDPMCGSGTSGAVAKELALRAVLCDSSDEYTRIVEERLGVQRLSIEDDVAELLETIRTQ